MKSTKCFIVGVALLISAPTYATELMTREQMKQCISDSYDIEAKDNKLERRGDQIDRMASAIDSIESDLLGYKWQLNSARSSLNMCRIQNNHNDSYCQHQIQRINNIVRQHNSELTRLRQIESNRNKKVHQYNSDLDRVDREHDRFVNHCYSKRIKKKDIEQLCNGRDTYFCNDAEKLDW